MFELTPYERRHQRALFNPFRDMDNFEKSFWGDMAAADFKTDIKDTGKEYVLEADLPGFKKDEVNVELENGYLTITAAKGLDKDEKNDKGVYIRRERYSGQCARTFYVGEAVTQEDIKAKFEDGILKVTIPKVEPKKVEDKKYIAIEG